MCTSKSTACSVSMQLSARVNCVPEYCFSQNPSDVSISEQGLHKQIPLHAWLEVIPHSFGGSSGWITSEMKTSDGVLTTTHSLLPPIKAHSEDA